MSSQTKTSRTEWVRTRVAWALWAYAVLIIVWYSLDLLIGDRVWLLGLLNIFVLYLFVPLPLMIVAALWLRRWTAWWSVLLVAIPFTLLFGADLTPPLPIVQANRYAGIPLTVMTYNVLASNTDATPIAATVTEITPDIIAFQELTPLLIRQLEEDIGDDYPFHTLLPAPCQFGVVIWSRYPLLEEPADEAIVEDINEDRERFCQTRSALIDMDGPVIRIVTLHASAYSQLLPADIEWVFRERYDLVSGVLAHFATQPEALILLGDFNSTPTHQVYRLLNAELVDAFREAGWGWGHTFPASNGWFEGLPYPDRLVRLDYIFHSNHWQAETAWVGAWDGASDHLPLIARLRLRTVGAPGSDNHTDLTR